MPYSSFNYTDFLRSSGADPDSKFQESFTSPATAEQMKIMLQNWCGDGKPSMTSEMLWIDDPALRQSRAQLSEKMRNAIESPLHYRQDIRASGGRILPGESLILASLRGNEKAYDQRLEMLKNVPESDAPEWEEFDRERRKQFCETFRSMTKGMTSESIRALSDEELTGKFQDFAALFEMRDHTTFLNGLPEEERKYINDFYNGCGKALDETVWRAQTIAAPHYQYIQTDLFTPAEYGKSDLEDLLNGDLDSSEFYEQEPTSLDSRAERDFEAFCMRGQQTSYLNMQRQKIGVFRAVEAQHESMITASQESFRSADVEWYCEWGKGARTYGAPERVVKDLRAGKTAYALMPDDTVVAVSGEARADGSISVKTRSGTPDEIVNMKRLTAQMDMKSLENALSDAHPWYKFSSDQFKEMKSAFKAVQDGLKTMGEKPTEQQRKEMQEKLTTLSEKCQSYVDYKRDRTGNYTNKVRMDVARDIKSFANDFKEILEMRDQVDQRQKAKHEEKRARHEAWQEKTQQGFAEQKDAANAFRWEEPGSNKAHAKTDIVTMYNKCGELQDIPTPESDCGKALENLKNEALAGVHKLIDGASLPSVDDQRRSSLGREMAALAALELIVQERGDHFDGKSGPLEQKCAANQEAFINMVKRSQAFEHGVGEITPQRLEKFIMEDGARKVATEIFRQAAERGPEERQSRPQPSVQKKAAGPQKQL